MIELKEIQNLCKKNALKWTAHSLERMKTRDITVKDVRNAILYGEIIEKYPDDYPYPSCLILGITVNNKYLHLVCGIGEGVIYVVTAYYPNPDIWKIDLKTRRKELL